MCQYPETAGGGGGGVGLEGGVGDELEEGKLEHAAHRKKEIARQQQLKADRKRFRVFLLGSSFIIQIWTKCDLRDDTERPPNPGANLPDFYITQPYSWCMKPPKGLRPGRNPTVASGKLRRVCCSAHPCLIAGKATLQTSFPHSAAAFSNRRKLA